jgi:hypothetical protein
LEERPILHRVNETLFVHGGIPPEAKDLLSKPDSLNQLNSHFFNHSTIDKLNTFLDETPEGRLVYTMLTYRGNHQEHSNACHSMEDFLPHGANRIVVGHTPSSNIRKKCNGKLLAVDSSLSRYFRNSGNWYCPGGYEIHSSNLKFQCDSIEEKCQGQIVKLTAGRVEVLTSHGQFLA